MSSESASLLVVDDNEDNLDMLSRRLTRQGFSTGLARSGQAAINMVRERRWELVLLDVMMPGLSGMDVLAVIRRTWSAVELPVIMVTAKVQSEDIVSALELGANDYVTKPIVFPVVLARVRTQLRLKRLAESKDEFLRIASHDLKNALTAVRASSEILHKVIAPGAVLTDEASQLAHAVARGADQMNRIIEDFLDFQALQDGQLRLNFSTADLNVIIRDAAAAIDDYARSKGISLRLELVENLPALEADVSRLGQVITNLLSNAIKFSQPGTTTTVRTMDEEEGVLCEVIDAGPGLTDADMLKLFGRYAKLSNRPTGGEKSVGLGLSICKRMIDLHDGDIGARNNERVGATFWFRVPLRQVTRGA